MSYLSYKNWFARNLQEKRWDWILSVCTSSNCCFQFQSKICTQNFGCLFSLFFSGIVFKLDPLKSTFDPQIPWFQLWIYRIDFTQLGSVLIKKLYLTISNWNFALHLTISGFSPSAFQRKNIHILHWKWPIWGSLRFFPSGSGGIKESHQKLRRNFHKFTKQQKHTHAIPMPLSPWRWGKVSFSRPSPTQRVDELRPGCFGHKKLHHRLARQRGWQLLLGENVPFFWIRWIDCYFVIGEKTQQAFIDEIHILFENITNAAASAAADVGFRPTSRIPLQASSLAWFAANGFKMEKRSTLQEVKWTGGILIWGYPQINSRFSNSRNPIITSYVLWFWELSYINKLKYHERNLISVYLA